MYLTMLLRCSRGVVRTCTSIEQGEQAVLAERLRYYLFLVEEDYRTKYSRIYIFTN